jgi:tight adherence protein C
MDIAQFQTILTFVSFGLIAVGVGVGGFLLARTVVTGARRRARLAGDVAASGPVSGGGGAVAMAGVMSGVRLLGGRMAIQDPAQVSALRAKLIQAGYFNREAVTVYLGARAVALGTAIVGTMLLLPWAISGGGGMAALLMAAVLSVGALIGPDQVVGAKRKKLELEYREGFPDLLDLLVASVEAGLSLDAGVTRVTDELVRRYPHLAEHLKVLTLELRAGRARKDCWSNFAERLGIDEARSMATMLRQAEDMGTSLGETLAVFSDDMRSKRMLRAEEKAMALPAKLMIPLILFIFPCLLGVLILPAAFRISQSMVGAHH